MPTTPLQSLRALLEAAPKGSPESLAWAKAIFAEAFRDKPAPVGPVDQRHPMERLYGNLIRAGEPVVLVGFGEAVAAPALRRAA